MLDLNNVQTSMNDWVIKLTEIGEIKRIGKVKPTELQFIQQQKMLFRICNRNWSLRKKADMRYYEIS